MEGIGVEIVSIDQLVQEHMAGLDSVTEGMSKEMVVSSLRLHILKSFQDNKDARETSGVNRLMLDSLRDYNGQYSPSDLSKIRAQGGSEIFMNLTSTKVRAAISWIKDILLAGKEDAFSIETTPEVELPQEIVDKVNQMVTKDFDRMIEESKPQPQQGQQPPEQGQQPPQQPPQAPDAAETLKEINERKRDLYSAILNEINKEAEFAFKIIERKIKDGMKEGQWDHALSEVIDDFCIFPTAFLKGPVVTVKKRLKWEDGVAVPVEDYVMMNKRVSPLDIYPAPEASSVNDGDFIEHLRMSRKEISSLIGVKHYDEDAIRRVLKNNEGKGHPSAYDSNIEQEKAQEELRDSVDAYNKNVYHGLHFFGTAPVRLLLDWGLDDPEVMVMDPDDEVEIEAILVGSEIIKCVLNDDVLGRRPYYSASYQKRPGSIWGTAPPYLMRDIQKMCNACARALSNNMGLSSGPITEINIDRLADGQDVRQLQPLDILQTTSDPSGASGKAVNFILVPSVAQELLAVYKEFEVRADDVTMIPRYAYGNERNGGAAQTASGMAMLLDSASKGIKDAIRHLDEGIIIPRVEMEFATVMLRGDIPFSGDIHVIAKGSQSLTMAGAEQMRRLEFLQTTANPTDQEIMGPTGRAEILRTMTKDLNLGEDVIPNRQEIKSYFKKKEQAQGQPSDNVQAAKIQNETILKIAQERNQLVAAELQRKTQRDQADIQLKAQDMQQRAQTDASKLTGKLQETQIKTKSEEHRANQAIALSLKTGDRANSV